MNVTLLTPVAPQAPAREAQPAVAPVVAGPKDAVQIAAPQAAPPAPAPAPATGAPSKTETGVLIPFIQRGARIFLAVAGAAAGAAVGAAAGVVVGGAMGASSGWLGKHHRFGSMLHPMENVAGLAGVPAHNAVAGLASKVAGDRVGGVVGRVVGGAVGAVTGGLIGALGVAWAGVDMGARAGASASSHLFGDAPACDRVDARKTYERGILKKQIPSPTGEINPDSHHWFYIKNGMKVLESDAQADPKLAKIHAFLTSDPRFVDIIQNGAWDMDTFLGSVADGISISTFHHFAEPFMPGFKAAEWQCRQAYDAASDAWKAGDREKALYYLGAAMHLPQDLALPQHSVPGNSFIGKMVGHQMMEGYLEGHFDQAVVSSGGRYFPNVETPEDFCRTIGAEASAQYGAAVKEAWQYVGWAGQNDLDPMNPPRQGQAGPHFTLDVYKQAGERAQLLTPGFIEMFFRDMEKQGHPI